MDPAYKDKLALLQKIVHDGIAKLLTEAKTKNFLEAPYGRLPFPTPLITEDEFIGDGALQSDDAEPEFKFEYGFDPLKVLAEFIIWSHPNSVEERRLKKVAAAQFLERRACHARRQVHIAQVLSALAHFKNSGILWGPLCSPLSCTSVLVTCKPLKFGKVILQISKFRDFREIIEKKETTVVVTGAEASAEAILSSLLPVKVTFKNLKPATKYFLRACLSSNPVVKVVTPKKPNDMSAKVEPEEDTEEECANLLFKGLHGEAFSYSEFWTMPSEDRSAQEAIELEEPSTASSDHPGHHKHHHGHHHHHHHHHKKPEAVIDTGDGSDIYPPVLLNCFGQLPVQAYTGPVAPPAAVPLHHSAAPAPRMDPYCPTVTCLLGDLLSKSETSQEEEGEQATLRQQFSLLESLSAVLARCPLFEGVHGSLHSSSFLLAWRDGSAGSHYSLRAEELVYKQYRADLKRHKKKFAKTKSTGSNSVAATLHMPPPPAIARLPLTESLQSLLSGLPIDPTLFADPVPEVPAAQANSKAKRNPAAVAAAAAAAAQIASENVKATRMMYRTQMMGPDVLLIVLDMRGQGTAGDYLGKEQAAWLDLVLQESTMIQWKIVLCGKTFGLINVPPAESSSRAEVEEEPEEQTEAEEKLAAELADATLSPPVEEVVDHTALEGISETHEMEVTVPTRTVQLPHDGDKNHAAITAAMTEDVEETYGRSTCCLQHLLAVHQARTSQSSGYNMTNAAGNRVMVLSSGIVLLTSGLSSISQSLVTTAAAHHHHSPQQDTCGPAYVAGYTHLSATPLSQSGDWASQVLPDQDNLTARLPSQLFCAEVALGSVGRATGGANAPDPASTFCYRDGFEAFTLYSALAPPGSEGTAPAPEQASGDANLSSATCCSLHLAANGQLNVKIYRADAALRDGTCRDTTPLFECVLEAPIPEDEEEDELEEEQ